MEAYKNAWNLLKQMVREYSKEKKYLTTRELSYIMRSCERSIKMYTLLNEEDSEDKSG